MVLLLGGYKGEATTEGSLGKKEKGGGVRERIEGGWERNNKKVDP